MGISFAYQREWAIESIKIDRYSSLKTNWETSKDIISTIRSNLDGASLPAEISTICAAGSLARMEASELSDADLIIICENDYTERKSPDYIFEKVWESLQGIDGLIKPKPNGIFSTPITEKMLIGKNLGSATEGLSIFGKRLLLLLESQPVYNNQSYKELIDNIIDRYAEGYVTVDPRKEWAFLLNDLLRYFRALCVNYQWDFENDEKKWPLRNIKLRHSRLIMYAGLLLLLGEVSKEREDKVAWLKENLNYTPLERIAYVYNKNTDWSYHRLAGLYNIFLSKISDDEFRDLLLDKKQYGDRYLEETYAHLKANSDALVAELLRFISSRRGIWSERFFEYLIF